MKRSELNQLARYSKAIEEHPRVTESQERDLVRRVNEGEQGSRDELFYSCLKLALKPVNGFARTLEDRTGRPFMQYVDDLSQDSCFSLLTGIGRLDPAKENKASTYLYKSILFGLRNSKKKTSKHSHITFEKSMGDFLEDKHPSAQHSIEVRELIDRAMESLSPREELVIRLRYGVFNGGYEFLEETMEEGGYKKISTELLTLYTVRTVGKALGISHEMVNRIENQALDKMRKALLPSMSN